MKTDTRKQVIRSLKKKSDAVWDLIVEAVNKRYKNLTEKKLKTAKQTYYGNCADEINKENYRYIIFEDYNIFDDFYWKFYTEEEVGISLETGEIYYGYMLNDYFSDVGGEPEDILFVDLKELKVYQIGKEVKYSCKEI